MNRQDRRRLTKGEKQDVNNHIIELQKQLNTKLADADRQLSQKIDEANKQLDEQLKSVDNMALEYGKNLASMVITVQLMPIIRDVLAFDLKVDEERIALFEEKFLERKDKRIAQLTKDEIEKDAEDDIAKRQSENVDSTVEEKAE